jgi:hypothetical protein
LPLPSNPPSHRSLKSELQAISQGALQFSNRDNKHPTLLDGGAAADERNLINLETILTVEDSLWSMLEAFRSLQYQLTGQENCQGEERLLEEHQLRHIANLCEIWWEKTDENNLNYLDRIFNN